MGIFGLEFEKTIVIFDISTFEFVDMQSLMFQKKKLNFGLKFLYLSTFGLEFEKTIVIFEFSNFELVKMQSFMLNKKSLTWDQNCLIWVFLE